MDSRLEYILRRNSCADGSSAQLLEIEEHGSISMYRTTCNIGLQATSKVTDASKLLHHEGSKRAVCSETCRRQCYTPAIDYPDPKDCDRLSEFIWDRDAIHQVDGLEGFAMAKGSCLYTFNNKNTYPITLCDYAWASIGQSVAWNCDGWSNYRGGICSNDDYDVKVLRYNATVGTTKAVAVALVDVPTASYPLTETTEVTETNGNNDAVVTPQSTLSNGASPMSSSMVETDDQNLTTDTSALVSALTSEDTHVSTSESTATLTSLSSSGGASVGDGTNLNNGHGTRRKTAPIVGGVIGSLSVIALVFLLILLRKTSKMRKRLQEETRITPLIYRGQPPKPSQTTHPNDSDSCMNLLEFGVSSPTPFSPGAKFRPQQEPVPEPVSIRGKPLTGTKGAVRGSSKEGCNAVAGNKTTNDVDSAQPQTESRRLRHTLSTVDLDRIALRVIRMIGRRMSIRGRDRDRPMYDIHDPPPPFEHI